jgi:cell division septal protein FtsQ
MNASAALIGQSLGSLNLKQMEQQLSAHPSVASAQVFHRLNGVLYVDLAARKPIARVSGVDEDFYLDENGRKFPLSRYYSPNVPLVRGVLDENMEPVDTLGCVLEEIMPVIQYVHTTTHSGRRKSQRFAPRRQVISCSIPKSEISP